MSDQIRLLVRADDAGSSWASNMGCLRACTDGIARSVEVMMPGAWVPHAARLFNPRPEIDVGIHLTLTSEWDAVKWRPLTPARSLVDEAGCFLPLLSPRDGDARPALAQRDWALDDIAAEFEAQVALGVATFANVSHVSAHMVRHFADFDPRVGDVVRDLCARFGLMDDPFGHGLPRIAGYPPHPRAASARVPSFVRQLGELAPGTYIFIDHPAVDCAALADVGHVGDEDARADRASRLDTSTPADLRAAVEARGIALTGYGDQLGAA